MKKLIECVPNFSEGVDSAKIQSIVKAIKVIQGVTVLDVDPGKDTNRTVVTFVGNPDSVLEAAFQGIKKASELKENDIVVFGSKGKPMHLGVFLEEGLILHHPRNKYPTTEQINQTFFKRLLYVYRIKQK